MKILISLLIYIGIIFNIYCQQSEWFVTGFSSPLKISADKKYLISEHFTTLRILDAQNFRVLYAASKSPSYSYRSRVLPDSNLYITIGNQFQNLIVNVLDLNTLKLREPKVIPLGYTKFAYISDDLKWIYCADAIYRIKIYDYDTGEMLFEIDSTGGIFAYDFDVSKDKELMAAVYKDKIFVLNLNTKEIIKKYDIAGGQSNWKIKLSPDKNKILVFSRSLNYIYCFKLDMDHIYNTAESNLMPLDVQFRSDSKRFLFYSSDGIREYDFETGKFNYKIELKIAEADIDMVDHNGIAVTFADSVVLWNFETQQQIRGMPVFSGDIDIQYNFDSRFIYVHKAGRIHRTDVATGKVLQKYGGAIGDLMPHNNWFWAFKDSCKIIFRDVFTLDSVFIKTIPYKQRRIHFSDNLKYYHNASNWSIPAEIYDWETDELVYRNDSAWGYGFSPQANYIFSWEGIVDVNERFLVRSFPDTKLLLDITNSLKQQHIPYFTKNEEFMHILLDSLLLIYKLPEAKLVKTYKRIPNGSAYYRITRNFKYLFEADAWGNIYIRDLDKDMIIDSIPGINAPIYSMGFSYDEKYFFVSYRAEFLRVMPAPEYIVSGVEQHQQKKNELNLHPNPASDYIEVAMPTEQMTGDAHQVRIYNMLGQCVINYELRSTNNEARAKIDIRHLPAGLYYIRIGSHGLPFIKN